MVSHTSFLLKKIPDCGPIFHGSYWNGLIFLPIAGLGFFLWTNFVLKGKHLLETLLKFLDKGAIFQYRSLLISDTTAPFVILFPTILRIRSVSIVCFSYCSKIVLSHTVCCCLVKGLSERVFWQGEERYHFHQKKPSMFFSWNVFSVTCDLNFLPGRIWPIWSKSGSFFVRFLKFVNVDYADLLVTIDIQKDLNLKEIWIRQNVH